MPTSAGSADYGKTISAAATSIAASDDNASDQ
jgi:hypothetical protein